MAKKLSKDMENRNSIYLQTGEMWSNNTQERTFVVQRLQEEREKLERGRRATVVEKTVVYPLCLIGLLLATALCLLMVAFNSLTLILGKVFVRPLVVLSNSK